LRGRVESGVLGVNLIANGREVLGMEAEVFEGVDDCLGYFQSLGVEVRQGWERGGPTIDIEWTEANQMAMSSWTTPAGVLLILLFEDSRSHWMQSFWQSGVSCGLRNK